MCVCVGGSSRILTAVSVCCWLLFLCRVGRQTLPQHGWIQPLWPAWCQHPEESGWGPQGELLSWGHVVWLRLPQAVCVHCPHTGRTATWNQEPTRFREKAATCLLSSCHLCEKLFYSGGHLVQTVHYWEKESDGLMIQITFKSIPSTQKVTVDTCYVPQWRAIVYYLKRSEEFPIFALILYSLTQLVSNYTREMFCHLQNSLSIWTKNRMVVGVSKRTEISFLKSTLKNVSFNHAEKSRRTVSFSMHIYLNLRYNWCQMSFGWIFKNSAVLSSLYVL